MTVPASSFSKARVEAARAFLRSVVVLDDHPAKSFSATSSLVVPVTQKRPTVGGPIPTDLAPPVASEQPPIESQQHELDAQQLQCAFADEGLLCSVFFDEKPDAPAAATAWRKDWALRLKRVGRLADAIVLDWSWNSDEGEFCTELIAALLEPAPVTRRQLVIIYTGETGREGLIGRLTELSPTVRDNDQMRFEWSSVGIVVQVLQKPRVAPEARFFNGSIVEEKHLASRLIELFAEVNGGLLSNAAMRGLGRIRDATHQILHRFRPAHDSAFVAHRAFTVPRQGAEDQVSDLLSDSIADQLDRAQIQAEVNEEAVRAWLGAQDGLQRPAFIEDNWQDEVARGFAGHKVLKKEEKPREKLVQLTRALSPSATSAEAKRLQSEFAAFIYCADDHPQTVPKLSNGTLLEETSTRRIMLCVMPLCDAERIGSATRFPFLEVSTSRKLGSRNFVAMTKDGAKDWSVRGKMTGLWSIEFGPGDTGGPVVANRTGEHWVFRDSSGAEYEFVGRLRPLVAHEITHALGASGARIGLMESEYVRLDF